MKYFALYLLFINIVSVLVCLADKIKAKVGGWRIPEKTLFIVSLMGGSVGMFAAMCLIRHKTKHKRFMIGLPLIIFAQSVLLIWLFHVTA